MAGRLLSFLAESCSSEVGQEALLAVPELRPVLAVNRSLSQGVWLRLWAGRPSAELAQRLVRAPLSGERVVAVLGRERRVTVLRQFLASSRLSVEQARGLLDSGRVDSDTAAAWFRGGTVPTELELEVALLGGSFTRLEFALGHPEVSDEQVVQWMLPHHGRALQCARLLLDRPGLTPLCLESGSDGLVLLACSSRFLFDQDVMLGLLDDGVQLRVVQERAKALLLNPNAGLSVIERCEVVRSGPALFSPVLELEARERARRFRFGVSAPWEVVSDPQELALLRHCAGVSPARAQFVASSTSVAAMPDARRVVVPVRRPAPARVVSREDVLAAPVDGVSAPVAALPVAGPTRLGPSVADRARLLEAELDALGPDAWLSAVTLLSDGFEGSVGELLGAARLL